MKVVLFFYFTIQRKIIQSRSYYHITLYSVFMAIPDHAQLVFTGKTFDVYQWEQEMFDGSTKTFEKLRRNHSIDIVAVDQDKKIYILEEEQP